MTEDYLSKYIEALNKKYEKDPVTAVNYLSSSINRLKHKTNLMEKLGLDYEKLDIILTIILAIMILPVGLICCDNLGMYLGGMIFFMAGLMVGVFVPGFGVIFLFSHGGTGFGLLNSNVIKAIMSSPILSEPNSMMSPYFSIMILTLGSAVLLTLVHAFVKRVRKVKFIKTTIMLLYLLGMLLLRLAPYKLGVMELFPFIN